MIYITSEQKQFVTENHSLIYGFLSQNNLSENEYYDLAAIGLCKAGMTFNEVKGKFSTYAYSCMRYEIYHDIRHNNRKCCIPQDKIISYQSTVTNSNSSTLDILSYMPSGINIEETITTKIILHNIISQLKPKEKKVIYLLSNGYSYREAGKMVGHTQQYVSLIKQKFVKKYNNAMNISIN